MLPSALGVCHFDRSTSFNEFYFMYTCITFLILLLVKLDSNVGKRHVINLEI